MIRCSKAIIQHTLSILENAGKGERECVVLWLADRTDPTVVREAYMPLHHAESDRFIIPPDAMRALMHHLRDRRFALVAQVHSHPKTAFHSWADDKYAIVRHAGALSVVVPYFSQRLSADMITDRCKFFRLSPSDKWVEVEKGNLASCFEVTP